VTREKEGQRNRDIEEQWKRGTPFPLCIIRHIGMCRPYDSLKNVHCTSVLVVDDVACTPCTSATSRSVHMANRRYTELVRVHGVRRAVRSRRTCTSVPMQIHGMYRSGGTRILVSRQSADRSLDSARNFSLKNGPFRACSTDSTYHCVRGSVERCNTPSISLSTRFSLFVEPMVPPPVRSPTRPVLSTDTFRSIIV
jgi:hypothetical protein